MVECCFTSIETIGLLGTGAQDGHLDFHTAPELCLQPFLCIVYIILSFLRTVMLLVFSQGLTVSQFLSQYLVFFTEPNVLLLP